MKKTHALIIGLALAGACIEGGANNGGNKSGNKDGGVVLAVGEIAIDTRGRYFLSRADGKLVVGDLSTKEMDRLEELPGPDIIAFWAHSSKPGFYLLSWTPPPSGSSQGGETLISYDLDRRAIAWTRELQRQDGRLDVSPDGARVVLGNGDDFIALDPGTGVTLWTGTFAEEGVRDVDITGDGARMIITANTKFDEERLPWTTIAVHAMSDGRKLCELTVPNCSSELVLAAGATRGFLAPTSCGRDPVSVIELDGESCEFRGNLPGFGPVALSPDGTTVAAFLDRDAMDETAPPLPEHVKTSADRYHLMFIDTETLEYETSPLGAGLPRYTFTPDGRSLLVDNDRDDEMDTETPIIILDVDARTTRRVEGPMIELDQYALSPDAAHAYVVDHGLFDLDIEAARVAQLGLSFEPVSINMTPDGSKLLLKSSIDSKVYIYELGSSTLSGEVAAR